MYVSLILASALAITLLAASIVVRYLSGPLSALLKELCGNADRAEFWTAFSNVTVMLTPAIFAMLADPSDSPATPMLMAVISQLRWGLIGLVMSVLMLGWILGRFLPKTAGGPPHSTLPTGGAR